MKIVVLDGHTLNPGDNPWDGVASLGELEVYPRTAREQVVERSRGAGIVLTNKSVVEASALSELPSLKFISVLATGYNVVDVKAARERGIPVSNVPAYGTESVAQHTMALLLGLCSRVGEHDLSVRSGNWEQCPDFCYWDGALTELAGKTMGIIGYGRIGRRVAEMARVFGMEVIYFRRPGAKFENPGVRGVDMEALCRESDVISLHCALTQENTGFVNQGFIAKLKPGAFLINTGRGALVNEPDLAEALHQGKLGGVALDVLSQEPPIKGNPLIGAPRCIITPHVAWASQAARRRLMKATEENIRAYLAGSPINVVNG